MLQQPMTRDDAANLHQIANRLFFRVYQASNLMLKAGTSAVQEFGVTSQQWAVLSTLAAPRAERQGLSIKELMDYLKVSRQSLTAILDRLEASGLIERTRANGDGRVRCVGLTSKGRRTWAAMQPNVRAFYEAALADLSLEESFLLMRLLERLCLGLAKL